MFKSRPVSLALVGLFVWVTACTSYKQIEPAEVADYDEVRVTFSDGEQLVSKDVTVEGDSIQYWQKPDKSAQYSAVRVSSPLDQVTEVEAKKKDLASTLVLVGVGVALVTVVTLRVVECATNSYGSEC